MQEKEEALDQIFNPNKYIDNSSILRSYIQTINQKLAQVAD